MEFEEILLELKKGKRARRKQWHKNNMPTANIFIDNDIIRYECLDAGYEICKMWSPVDISSDDWEIIEVKSPSLELQNISKAMAESISENIRNTGLLDISNKDNNDAFSREEIKNILEKELEEINSQYKISNKYLKGYLLGNLDGRKNTILNILTLLIK
ncbi:MAG: DUF2829 domain-containing protein [Firmicutes bacterium]|nr:DUF2829 domain-containing protein [Bacillota bacterium]